MQNVLGVQLFTVRDFTQNLQDFEQTIKKIAAIGYKAVQVSAIGPLDPDDVARICFDNQISIVGTHFGWADFQDKTQEIIAKHQKWNCKHSALGILPVEYYTAGLDGIKRFVYELPPVLEELHAADLDFSYHNHDLEFAKYDGKVLLEWLYELGGEGLLPEIDTCWIQVGGRNPANWIRKFPGRQPLLHLKDLAIYFDGTTKEQRTAAIGEGNLDWDKILAAAADSNCQWYLVEQDHCYGRDPFDCLDSSYRFLANKGLQ